MITDHNLAALLTNALEDHQLVGELIASYQKLTGDETRDCKLDAVRTILRIINKTLIDHIAHEDREIYPAILKTKPTESLSRSIREIQEEHQTLLDKAKLVNAEFLQEGSALASPQLHVVMQDFIAFLKDHSLKEDELFHAVQVSH